ncbi:MAG TPA: CAP domain-containing protein [Bacillota bacterium]|nr:CAP domain-containing protein [Bacillota bacterium]
MALAAKPKRKPASSGRADKHRRGQHHKQNDHYLKTYWPYIPLIAIAAFGLFFNSILSTAHKNVLGYATSMSITELLNGTNNQRTANGLGALAINSQLNSAAQAKANDMVARDYWAHVNPDGQQPWVYFVNAGYNYQTAGENLAYGFDSADAAITAWMNSPEHKANILNNTYVDVGFGVANSSNFQGTGPETIVVAEYGSPQPNAQPVAAATPTPAKPTPAAAQPAQTPEEAHANEPASANESTANSETGKPQANATTKVETDIVPAPVQSKNISRIQLISGTNASWSMFAVSTIATISLAIFFLRHGLLWHRTLIKGERFIMKHKLLDLVLVAVGVLAVVLTRSAGRIF